MPVYNAEKFVGKAIDSILAQTFTDFEFIIINDGSTDSSEEIIQSYSDARIRYIKNDSNLKLIKTLNKGIELAKGEFIARMDSDDISLPERFENQIKIFESNNEIDFINGRAYNINENGELNGQEWIYLSPNSLKYISIFACVICHPSVMIKANILKKYKYRDLEKTLNIEDYDLWCRLLLDGHNAICMDAPVLNYRLSSTSITATCNESIKENLLKVTNEHLSHYNYSISPEALNALKGYNNTYEGGKALKNELGKFQRNVLGHEKASTIIEFETWAIKRILRISKRIISEKKTMEFIQYIFLIIIPLFIQHIKTRYK